MLPNMTASRHCPVINLRNVSLLSLKTFCILSQTDARNITAISRDPCSESFSFCERR